MTKYDRKFSEAIIDLLMNVNMFDELDHEELRIIVNFLNTVDMKPGDVVVREGKVGNFICFVADGKFEVIKKRETGENISLSTLTRGASIGEMSIVDRHPRSATVQARTKGTLITLSAKAFEQILEEHPRLGLKILIGVAKLLSRNLRYASATLADRMLPLE